MADVAPFRAYRYNPAKFKEMVKVVAPPYDVISPEEQDALYGADPHNIIRVELNRKREGDDDKENRYTRAARHLLNWRDGEYLVRDAEPGFYISETTYLDAEGNTRVRHGFFTLLRVEDRDAGKVLPHERTFTSHREDRFKLTRATESNVSPIFALYPDDENLVQTTLEKARRSVPLHDFTDSMGLGQKLYAVTDPAALSKVRDLMADKVIFIADGHHRYETSIAYRDYMRERHPEAGPDATFNYVMTYLCSMSDPGLTIFACHRMLPNLGGFAARDFLSLAKAYFDIREVDAPEDHVAARDLFTQELARSDRKGNTIGLVSHDERKLYVLTIKDGVMDEIKTSDTAGPLSGLDVVVLTSVVLEKILGLDDNARDKEHTITYVSNMVQVLDQVWGGKARLAFLLNPTRVEQVQEVATAGYVMPRKATYFYPKVLTGLTLNHMDPRETVAKP